MTMTINTVLRGIDKSNYIWVLTTGAGADKTRPKTMHSIQRKIYANKCKSVLLLLNV